MNEEQRQKAKLATPEHGTRNFFNFYNFFNFLTTSY